MKSIGEMMIQDIYPSRLYNEFRMCEIEENDYLLAFNKDGKVLVKEDDGRLLFSTKKQVGDVENTYLFSIDEQKYFLALDGKSVDTSALEKEGFVYLTVRKLRDHADGNEIYAGFTAYHLWRWYADNKYCGRCGEPLNQGDKERSLVCPKCGNTVYPRINPAVIVGVRKGDYLLLTKYKRGFAHNALVAGFTEIGETLEETVAREVMEETGIKVKNITYYKSQPWGMAQDILVGFYCEADGDSEIHMDESELKYAEWVKREDIVLQPNNLSLTNEMMRMFKEGKDGDF